jgi:hypothetical protein
MFVTLCRADQVFQDILEEALAWTGSNLGHTSGGGKIHLKLLSHVPDLNLSLALDLLRQLQRCHLGVGYVLQSPHRVVLSDAVYRYCERYNQQAHTFGLHNQYGLLDLNGRRWCDSLSERRIRTALSWRPMIGSRWHCGRG